MDFFQNYIVKLYFTFIPKSETAHLTLACNCKQFFDFQERFAGKLEKFPIWYMANNEALFINRTICMHTTSTGGHVTRLELDIDKNR